LDSFCGSSPERLQLWNANAGTAELISSGWALPVLFNSHDIAASGGSFLDRSLP
jgi:hypothetical protein